MNPNPFLKKLGLAQTDRAVIIHTDDIGMCQASSAAFADLVDFGLISSGATMVPCSWFPQVAAYCRAHPNADLGVHLTLTSEWNVYRWGPISTRDPATGLMDDEGYLHRTSQATQEHADPAAVQTELQSQLARALQAGIDVTHIDTHMGTVAHPKFVSTYIQLALQHHIPAMIPRLDAARFEQMGMDKDTAIALAQSIVELESQGVPLLDHMEGMPLDQPKDRIEQVKNKLSNLPAGVTHFVIHPSMDTPELRAITPDWPSRVADYQAFTSEELRTYVQSIGIHVMGYRALRDAWRGSQ